MLPSAPLLLALTLGCRPATPTTTPTVLLTVSNPSPSTAYTLLTWGSPLDPLAFALGHFPLTLVSTNASIPLNVVAIKRAGPPNLDAYLTIRPGENLERTVILREPTVDLRGLAGQRVRFTWDGERGPTQVWKGGREELFKEGRIASGEEWWRGDLEWEVDTGAGVEILIPTVPKGVGA